MTSFTVTLKEGSPEEELTKAKESVKQEGGEIKHEFTLIKGFTAELPDDSVKTLNSNDHINVEADGEVRTQ